MKVYDIMSDDKYYVLTEQGDLGLGAVLLEEADQEIMTKNDQSEGKYFSGKGLYPSRFIIYFNFLIKFIQ